MTRGDASLDFETRSAVDLKTHGADVYARHPSTIVLCLAWALPGEREPRLWVAGEPCPPELALHVELGGTLRAWNAHGFERLIWQHVCAARMGWPAVQPEQWVCTMQEAMAVGLPGRLDDTARVLKLEQRKDKNGTRLINELCIIKLDAQAPGLFADTGWQPDPSKLLRLYAYCMQDVRVEMAAAARLSRLRPSERALALLDAEINQRGVRIDTALVNALQWMTDEAKAALNAEMHRITDGAVRTTDSLPALKAWLGSGALAKDDISVLLADTTLPENARAALICRQTAAKSSTAKLRSMLAYASGVNGESRNRGLLQYMGGHTGRWAGRGMQPQNLPRAAFAKPETVIAHIFALVAAGQGAGTPEWDMFECLHGDVFSAVSKLLRACIVPAPDHLLHACDLAGIESRVLAWLAGEAWKLQLFRDNGDPYIAAGSAIFGRAITKADKWERLLGKVAELACGYQGAVGAFASMGRVYGVKVPEEEALAAVRGWRSRHPATVRFWYALNDAAIEATRRGTEGNGKPVPVADSGVASRVVFAHAGGHLWMRLPNGRALRYCNARLGKSYPPNMEPRDCVIFDGQRDTGGWGPVTLYGGRLAENLTQAVARDVLVAGMWEAEKRGLRIVLHVHDELVVEAPATRGDAADVLLSAMLEGPRKAGWCAGLPLDAEVDATLSRYRK